MKAATPSPWAQLLISDLPPSEVLVSGSKPSPFAKLARLLYDSADLWPAGGGFAVAGHDAAGSETVLPRSPALPNALQCRNRRRRPAASEGRDVSKALNPAKVDYGPKPGAEAIRRLATDPRMKNVWKELFRREGRDDGYKYHPIKQRVRANPHWESVSGTATQADGPTRLLEEACLIIFSVAAGHFVNGMRVRTIAEVTDELEACRLLAKRLDEAADECANLGFGGCYPALLKEVGASVSGRAERLQSIGALDAGGGVSLRNPWIVARESKNLELKDPSLRGFVVAMVNTCRGLFGNDMPGIVAQITRVAFNSRITVDAVIGTARGIEKPPGLKRPAPRC